MTLLSIWIGLLLIALGVGGYSLTGMASPTAMIPAAFGLVIAIFGAYGRAEARRRTAMHLAMGVALVGILGSVSGFFEIAGVLARGGDLSVAALSKAAMAVLLMVYLGLGIRSFVRARRRPR